MRFKQLNIGWGAEPNAPDPQVEMDIQNRELKLRFYINPFIYKDVEEDTLAEIVFSDCYMYRLGSTNDEGFLKGKCRFSNSGIGENSIKSMNLTGKKDFQRIM